MFSVEVTPGTAVPVNTRKTVTLRVYLSSTDTTVRDSIQCATVKMGTAAPQLLGPADGEETSALPALVLTAGQPAGEPVRFAIELASGDNVACFTSDPVESGAEAGLVLPEELRLPAGEWRWRAKAIDATGAESDWSETGRFVVVDE